MLCMLLLLRLPCTRVVFVTSQPVAESTIGYYLGLLAGLPLAGLAPGLEDGLLVAVTERRSKEDIDRLADAMDRRGDDPSDRFDALWDELESWFAEDGFRGSFVANAATELRSEPDHPAQTKIAQHRGEAYLKAYMRDPSNFYDEQRYRRLMPTQNLSEVEIDNLIKFLDWVSKVDNQGWPPRPILVAGGSMNVAAQGTDAAVQDVRPVTAASAAGSRKLRLRRKSSRLSRSLPFCADLSRAVSSEGTVCAGPVGVRRTVISPRTVMSPPDGRLR